MGRALLHSGWCSAVLGGPEVLAWRLRARARHCRARLEDFEARQRDWRARLAEQPNILC